MIDENLLQNFSVFFPQDGYREEDIEAGIESGDIIVDPAQVVGLLQNALHDESIVELLLGDFTRVFFCRVLDHPPELIEKEDDGVTILVEPEYTKGEYLAAQSHLILTPIEPSMGNYLICNTPRMLLRILTSKCAFEFGCYFEEKIRIRGMLLLQCSFPAVTRQVKGARAYRAKIPRDMELLVEVRRQGKKEDFATCPVDISAGGMMLIDPAGKYTDLSEEEKVRIEMLLPGEVLPPVDAKVQHVVKLRDKKGIQYCFGLQFDLATRSLASDMERLVAGVQRRRLRELAGISEEFGVDFGKW